MTEDDRLFGVIPKKRRTTLRTIPNTGWRRLPEIEEDASVLSDEAEVAAALGILASAASFAETRGDGEADSSGLKEPQQFRQRRKLHAQQGWRARGELKAEPREALGQGPSQSEMPRPSDRKDDDWGAAGQLPPAGVHAAGPNFSGVLGRSGDGRDSAQELIHKPTFKRCASHVYIARFIEQHMESKRRLEKAQNRHTNGFGGQQREVELPERPTVGIAPGGFGRHALTADGPSALPPVQDLPSASHPHSFLGVQHFPSSTGSQGHNGSLQGLPPAYAHMLGQQNGFPPFMPPGLPMGGGFSAQQQAAAAQALAGFQGMFPSHMMFPGAFSPQLGPVVSNGVGSAPVPSLPLSIAKAHPHIEGPQPPPKLPHSNGTSGFKPDDGSTALLKLGLSPAAIAGVDMERLRAILPPGFLEQRGALLPQPQLPDGLKVHLPRGEQAPIEAWGSGLPTRL